MLFENLFQAVDKTINKTTWYEAALTTFNWNSDAENSKRCKYWEKR